MADTIGEIVELAPIALEFLKGACSLFERFFPPKSGAAKSAAVVQATQSLAAAQPATMPQLTPEQIQVLIEAALPVVLAELANPPGATAPSPLAQAPSKTHGVIFVGSTPTPVER